jgi:hypothetical protein
MAVRNDPALSHFICCANAYALLIEQTIGGQMMSLPKVSKALATLYAAAHDLPDLELADTQVNPQEQYSISHDQWKAVYDAISKGIDANSIYWTYFDVTDQQNAKEEPVCTVLEDDLADIYRDLKPGLRAWETGNDAFIPEIVFEWKLSFQSHWGKHALDGMRTLYDLMQK